MHSEYLTDTKHAENDDFQIEGSWFIEGGVTPEGKPWVAPSPSFLDRWLDDDRLSDRLSELGFSHATDGKAVGASQSFIFYFPPNLPLREELN